MVCPGLTLANHNLLHESGGSRRFTVGLLGDSLGLDQYYVRGCICRRCRGRFPFAAIALKALGTLDGNLPTGCKVGSVPTTAGLLAIDLDLDLVAGDVCIVLAGDFNLCLFHSSVSRAESWLPAYICRLSGEGS